jgi:magnesium transporter
MTTQYASLPAGITVQDALSRLRQQAPDSETIYYVYILGEDRHLEGFISLRQLILARPEALLSGIMQREPIRVRATEPRAVAAQLLARYNFIAVPIVDEADRLVGIVTHDDALDVVQEEATEDAYLQSAVAPLEDTYQDTPLPVILWKRGVWLLFLSVVALMNAHVIDHYRLATDGGVGPAAAAAPAAGLTSLILLFLPLVMASGGNAGSQSATLFIRMFALQPSDSRNSRGSGIDLPLVGREFLVGLSLGTALATMDFTVAWLWFGRTPWESAVIAITVITVVSLGTSAGTLFPLLFRRLGMDPAIMSNPLIAAMIDVLGVVLFYEIGSLLLQ